MSETISVGNQWVMARQVKSGKIPDGLHGMPEVVKVRENGEVAFGRATQSLRKRFQPAVVNGSQGPFTKRNRKEFVQFR